MTRREAKRSRPRPRNRGSRNSHGFPDLSALTRQTVRKTRVRENAIPHRGAFSPAEAREAVGLVRVLVTGVSGYVGAALVPRLNAEGHEVRGFARSPERVAAAGVHVDDLVIGDAVTGAGLDRAL